MASEVHQSDITGLDRAVLRNESSILVQLTRKTGESTPCQMDVLTTPFYNTMFAPHFPFPVEVKLRDEGSLRLDSPLEAWMGRVVGYELRPDDDSDEEGPDFSDILAQLSNVLVVVIAAFEMHHARVMPQLWQFMDVMFWTKYFVFRNRVMHPVCTGVKARDPPLLVFRRSDDMLKICDAPLCGVKSVVNTLFKTNGDIQMSEKKSHDALKDCEEVYLYMLHSLETTELSLSMFVYGMEVLFLKALFHQFPGVLGTEDYREVASIRWSDSMHREIESHFLRRQMMHNQVTPSQLETIAANGCESKNLRVVMQTGEIEMLKGRHTLGLRMCALSAVYKNQKAASKTAVIPTQPKFYSCTFWRMFQRTWSRREVVPYAGWCSHERRSVMSSIFSSALQHSGVYSERAAAFNKENKPLVMRRVIRRQGAPVIREKTRARLEQKAKKYHNNNRNDDDDTTLENVERSRILRQFYPNDPPNDVPATTQKSPPPPSKTRKRKVRKWNNSKSEYYHKCVQLLDSVKPDVVSSLGHYATLLLACQTGSCDSDAASTGSEEIGMHTTTHRRKQRRVFASSTEQKTRKRPLKECLKPKPSSSSAAFIRHLFCDSLGDRVWREPILEDVDTMASIVLYRDPSSLGFKFGNSCPCDLDARYSLRFVDRALSSVLLSTTPPDCYKMLDAKSGFGARVLAKFGNEVAQTRKWRCVFCASSDLGRSNIVDDWAVVDLIGRTVACVYPPERDARLTLYERTLLQCKRTLTMLTVPDLVTWFEILTILYRSRADVLEDMSRIFQFQSASRLAWELERAVLVRDAEVEKRVKEDKASSDLLLTPAELYIPEIATSQRELERRLDVAWLLARKTRERLLDYTPEERLKMRVAQLSSQLQKVQQVMTTVDVELATEIASGDLELDWDSARAIRTSTVTSMREIASRANELLGQFG